MDDISRMKILKSIEDLQEIIFYLAFSQSSLSFEKIIQGFVGAKF